MYEVKVYKNENDNDILGNVYLTLDDKMTFRNIFLKESNEQGMRLVFPSRKVGEEYKSFFYPISKEFYANLLEAAVSSYEHEGSAYYINVHEHQNEAYSEDMICDEMGSDARRYGEIAKSHVVYDENKEKYVLSDTSNSYKLVSAYMEVNHVPLNSLEHNIIAVPDSNTLQAKLGDEMITEMYVRNGKDTDFIALPSYRRSDGTFSDMVYIKDKEFEEQIKTEALEKYNDILKKSKNSGTLVINAFGGPGAGKTTACLDICSELKKAGYNAEYVQEYPKELVYQKEFKLLDGSLFNQTKILNEQNKRQRRLLGEVDFIVTDSPLLLSEIYLKTPDEGFDKKVTELFDGYNNFSFFIKRDESSFQQEGRIHNLEESKEKDIEIKKLLDNKSIYYKEYKREDVGVIVKNAITTFEKMHKKMNKKEKVR